MKYEERRIRARNPWFARAMLGRGPLIAGVMLHATRGGRSAGDDGPGTEDWAAHPSNKAPGGYYGSSWDVLIYESGLRVLSTNWDNELATWCAGFGDSGTWAAGIYYVQIEVSQGRPEDPYTFEEVDSCAEFVAGLAHRYDFPLERIPYLSQTGTPPRGICTHEDSANGKKLRKSDPGPMWPWDQFLALARDYYEEADVGRIEDLEAQVATLQAILVSNGVELIVESYHLTDPEVRKHLPDHVAAGDIVTLRGESALGVAKRLEWSAYLGIGRRQQEDQRLGKRINEVKDGLEAHARRPHP